MGKRKIEISPSWQEFISAINAQNAQFMEVVTQSEERTGARLLEITSLIKETNDTTRTWVEELRKASDIEHKRIEKEAQLKIQAVNTRVSVLTGLLVPFGLGFVGLLFFTIQEAIKTNFFILGAK